MTSIQDSIKGYKTLWQHTVWTSGTSSHFFYSFKTQMVNQNSVQGTRNMLPLKKMPESYHFW